MSSSVGCLVGLRVVGVLLVGLFVVGNLVVGLVGVAVGMAVASVTQGHAASVSKRC